MSHKKLQQLHLNAKIAKKRSFYPAILNLFFKGQNIYLDVNSNKKKCANNVLLDVTLSEEITKNNARKRKKKIRDTKLIECNKSENLILIRIPTNMNSNYTNENNSIS